MTRVGCSRATIQPFNDGIPYTAAYAHPHAANLREGSKKTYVARRLL